MERVKGVAVWVQAVGLGTGMLRFPLSGRGSWRRKQHNVRVLLINPPPP